LFLHQDYSDQSTVAQIEIAEQRAMLFNAGAALVGRRGLAEGGKSQCRNPLLARALRLIGFAELAGSGLRALNQAWRREKRRPPAVESDEKANTFTLILDWRTLPQEFDVFWKQRLGVTLKPVEASALTIAAETGGISSEQLAAYLGTTVNDADVILKSLSRNALIHMKEGKAVIQEHLEQLVQEARSGSRAARH
jgi:predicted HTH transcriptional regulator